MPARIPAPLQLPHGHLMGCPQTDPGHWRCFQHRTHPHWERAQPRCPSHPRIMPQVGPIPKGIQPSPGACFTHKGSFAFPIEFSLLSNLLFSEAPPSIHPFPTFAAQNLLFSLLFQFPSSPWPLPSVSWEKKLTWENIFLSLKALLGAVGALFHGQRECHQGGEGFSTQISSRKEEFPIPSLWGWGWHLVMVPGVVLAPHGAVLVEFMGGEMLLTPCVRPTGFLVLLATGIMAVCCWRKK